MALSVLIAPGVYRIPLLPYDLLNVYALTDDDGQVTLVDAGLPTSSGRIMTALAEIGAGRVDVTRIIATHNHVDHVGGLKAVAGRTGSPVAVHADDAQDVRDGRGSPMDPAIPLGRLLHRQPVGSGGVPVSEELHDGQLLPVAGGLEVVHTPGHTPGHISLLHRPTETLITGDAIWNMNSRRTWPIFASCSDGQQTKQTAERLGDLEYRTAAFTHGPEIRDTGREAIRSFLVQPRGFRLGV